MEISTGVLWGLISMVSWGVADYLARSYSIQEGGGRTAFYIRLISLFPPIFVLALQAYLGQVHSPIDWPVIWKLGPLLGVVMALATEVYVQRNRLRALERQLQDANVINIGDLDQEPSDAERQTDAKDREQFVEGLLINLLGRQQAKGAT